MLGEIEFANPGFFWLLLLLPLMMFWYIWKARDFQDRLIIPTAQGLLSPRVSLKVRLRHVVPALRILALGLIITGLARPQSATSWKNSTTEGIDIIIATDISGSMLAEDFKPNRLEAGKNIAIDFIRERPADRIGLVVFSGESFTQCPLTIDHSVLINMFSGIRNGMIEDGTAIGMGLATAVNRLKESQAKSKVVILLTDGSNNAGSVPPLTAADIAKHFGVRVYTVGVGTNGFAPYPVPDGLGGISYQRMPVQIDEATLSKIAKSTGGRYFRATDNNKLQAIYQQIDQLEKAKIAVTQYRKKTELFLPFVVAAAILLLLEFILGKTLFKSILS